MKVSGFTFVTLIIAVALPAQNCTVEYLPGSTVQIMQLVGDQQDYGEFAPACKLGLLRRRYAV